MMRTFPTTASEYTFFTLYKHPLGEPYFKPPKSYHVSFPTTVEENENQQLWKSYKHMEIKQSPE